MEKAVIFPFCAVVNVIFLKSYLNKKTLLNHGNFTG